MIPRRLETLGRVPLYATVPPDEIARLDTRCIWRRHDAGQWILDYDEDGTDVFFITAGHVRVLIRAIGGQDVILRDIADGGFFGELAALDGEPRSAGILAVTAVTVARMPAGVFRETIHRWPDVADAVLGLLAGQVRRLSRRVNEYGTLNARHRIYAELLRLARPAPDGRGAVISPPPTHAEIGARVAARREAVNRELRALEKDGLLEKRRGALVLTDTDRLVALIQEAEEA